MKARVYCIPVLSLVLAACNPPRPDTTPTPAPDLTPTITPASVQDLPPSPAVTPTAQPTATPLPTPDVGAGPMATPPEEDMSDKSLITPPTGTLPTSVPTDTAPLELTPPPSS